MWWSGEECPEGSRKNVTRDVGRHGNAMCSSSVLVVKTTTEAHCKGND